MNLDGSDKNYLIVPLLKCSDGLNYQIDAKCVLRMVGLVESEKDYDANSLVFSQ